VLELQVRFQLAEFPLEARLAVPIGVTMLVGESGSGKTTLLRLTAGILRPDSGRITLGGRVLFDRDAGVCEPPRARGVGYVSQDDTLFPHLSVRENVAFGLHAAHRPAAEVRDRAQRTLERFGLLPLAERRPRQLSGGQQQRVALARAVVLDPEVLLLDEPLSALDLATRRALRGELRRQLESLPCATLFVTHHPGDALAFGDRIAVMERGRITQSGARDEFLRHPGSAYVAEFLGVNLVAGVVAGRAPDGLALVTVGDRTLAVPDLERDGPVRMLIHPREVVLSRQPPVGSARNVLRGVVEEVLAEPPGVENVRVILAGRPALAALVTRQSAERLGLKPGIEAYASFKASAILVLPN